MRILMASVSLTALFLSGCVTLQKYPAFGNAAGGRVVEFDRQGAKSLLPPSKTEPVTVPSSRYAVIR